MTPGLVRVARQAFRNQGIPESEVLSYAVDVPLAVYVSAAGSTVGFASAATIDSTRGPVVFLEGTVLGAGAQGRHLYDLLIGYRMTALAPPASREILVATRTQNPVVARRLVDFGFDRPGAIAEDLREPAGMVAKFAHGRHAGHLASGGLAFDSATGICRSAYAEQLYRTMPRSGDADIDGWFEKSLDHVAGDAVILVAALTRSAVDERIAKFEAVVAQSHEQ